MKSKNEKEDLLVMIYQLQQLQEVELASLEAQFQQTYESIKPLNLIKNTLLEVTSSPDIRHNIANNLLGLATGYASKKLLLF